jgi:hypothetical protein
VYEQLRRSWSERRWSLHDWRWSGRRCRLSTCHLVGAGGQGLPPPLLEVVVSHVLGWENRATSAAFRAVCTTWNAAHDALCSRLAPLLCDGRREVTHEAKWLTRFPQVCFPSLLP